MWLDIIKFVRKTMYAREHVWNECFVALYNVANILSYSKARFISTENSVTDSQPPICQLIGNLYRGIKCNLECIETFSHREKKVYILLLLWKVWQSCKIFFVYVRSELGRTSKNFFCFTGKSVHDYFAKHPIIDEK